MRKKYSKGYKKKSYGSKPYNKTAVQTEPVEVEEEEDAMAALMRTLKEEEAAREANKGKHEPYVKKPAAMRRFERYANMGSDD